MTPLARWLTHRIALMGAGIATASAKLERVEARHRAKVVEAHRKLAELDKLRDQIGELAADLDYGCDIIERLAIAKERAECELANEEAEARRGPCEEQVAAE